jgi:bifunctional non-homologous end joining protein LigD
MTPTTIIQSTTLQFREGSSDKVYQAAIEEHSPGSDTFIVTFAYGRRGTTLQTGSKTPQPVSREAAIKIHDKLVASKQAKGYRATGEPGTTYHQHPDDGRDTGIRPQLLNPVDESELSRLLTDTRHCLQEKHDGRRLMVRKQGGEITGINRRGLSVAIPDTIREAVGHIPFDVLIDGEAVGDTLHAFDLLEVKGTDFRQRRYIDRFAALIMTIPPNLPALRWVSTPVDPNDKVEIYEELRATNREGAVFKDINAPYSPGRPASGGPQLKFKFVETASFLVGGVTRGRRSVALELINDSGQRVPAGNVTIPPNQAIPQMGTVVEVRFLYAFPESGAIYQPVYLGPRDDIPAEECTVDQLKFKPQPTTA